MPEPPATTISSGAAPALDRLTGRIERRARGRSPLLRMARTAGAAACVRESARFAANELFRSGTRTYTLRQRDLQALIRHPLLDAFVLEEIFRARTYEPPPEVSERIAGLGRPPHVLDLGGHVGLYALYALTLFPDADIVSWEPDPRNAEILERVRSLNGLELSWQVVRAAAGTEEAEVDFVSAFQLSGLADQHAATAVDHQALVDDSLAFLGASQMMQPVSVRVAQRDALPDMCAADLVKIDIEGAEWHLLADNRLKGMKAQALVLEYHLEACPAPDPMAHLEQLLRAAGYRLVPQGHAYHGAGTAWAVRADA
ncbi:MAG: hypothetical protein QOG62_2444 [Thermoleophilaceae bacterium]|jgi:FkbM family methyltransferase|nr:hypothetical protein [Thermoleophilaceae bacterium]